jgi:Sigma-70 region 3
MATNAREAAAEALSPHLRPLFGALLAAHPDGLSLDELGEELVRKPVTHADIEELIGALEEAGFDLAGPGPQARPEELARVLTAARALTAETGKRPTAAEIAERAGLSPIAVRRALRLGRSAGD